MLSTFMSSLTAATAAHCTTQTRQRTLVAAQDALRKHNTPDHGSTVRGATAASHFLCGARREHTACPDTLGTPSTLDLAQWPSRRTERMRYPTDQDRPAQQPRPTSASSWSRRTPWRRGAPHRWMDHANPTKFERMERRQASAPKPPRPHSLGRGFTPRRRRGRTRQATSARRRRRPSAQRTRTRRRRRHQARC